MRTTNERIAPKFVLALLLVGCCCPPPQEASEVVVQERESEDEFLVLDAEAVRQRLWPEPGPEAYVSPSVAQSRAMVAFAKALFAAQPRVSGLRDLAEAAGYAIEAWQVSGRRYLVALERPDRRGGGGAILVRVDVPAGPAVLLQAPHAFHDLDTERIGLDLFLTDSDWPQALFVSTIHRYIDSDGVRRKRSNAPADPCHNPGHLLALATAAAIEVLPEVEVVQLHGFGDRDFAEELPPDAIVSAGERTPSPRVRAVASALRGVAERQIAVFGEDIDHLGALTNVQGHTVRARGSSAGFVHLELSAPLRQQLRSDPALLQRFAAALQPSRPPRP